MAYLVTPVNTVYKYTYPANVLSLPETHDTDHTPGLNQAGKKIFWRHSNLSMAIANQDEEAVEAILKPYYMVPEKPGQVLWAYCSLCHKSSRRFNTKKLMFLAQKGFHEITWRSTPDILDLGYIVADSLRLGNWNQKRNVTSIESALSIAICLSSRTMIQKLLWAGACLNCLEACSTCFMDVDRLCQCTEFTLFFRALSWRSEWEDIQELMNAFILLSGELIPRKRSLSSNLFLKDAACVGSFKAIKLLIESGEDPARQAPDGSTAVCSALRCGFKDLENTAAIIMHMVQCHQMYSTKVMDGIMFPGNSLDFRRWPTLEFMMRMIITAIYGEWDWKHTDLVRIDVRRLFLDEEWMHYTKGLKGQIRKEQELAARVLFEITKFPSASEHLSSVTKDWVQYLFQHSLETPIVPHTEQPMSLKETARHVVRRNLKAPLHRSLEQLGVPENIKDYVLMRGELENLVDVRKIINRIKENA